MLQFPGIACGSIAELDTQLELAVRLGYLKTNAASVSQSCRVGYLVRALRTARNRQVMRLTAKLIGL